jgi:hypothetical protein
MRLDELEEATFLVAAKSNAESSGWQVRRQIQEETKVAESGLRQHTLFAMSVGACASGINLEFVMAL